MNIIDMLLFLGLIVCAIILFVVLFVSISDLILNKE